MRLPAGDQGSAGTWRAAQEVGGRFKKTQLLKWRLSIDGGQWRSQASRGPQQWRTRLPSQRRGFDPWVRKTPWRWKWQPTPVFSPGESRGQRSLGAHTVRGVTKESDKAEQLSNNNDEDTNNDHAFLNASVGSWVTQDQLLRKTRLWGTQSHHSHLALPQRACVLPSSPLPAGAASRGSISSLLRLLAEGLAIHLPPKTRTICTSTRWHWRWARHTGGDSLAVKSC